MPSEKDFDATEHFGDKHSSMYDKKIRKVIRGYEESLTANSSILISGLGTGYEAIMFAKNQEGWHITGVDPTPEMIQSSKERIEKLGLENRVRIIEGTVENISGENFDAATSILVMQFLKDNGDKEKYLKSIANKLRKEGKIIVIDLEGKKNSQNFNMLLSAWKCHQFSTREDKEQIVKDFEHVDSDLQFIPEERIKELLELAGFTNICKFYQSYLFGGYIAEKA